MMTSTNCNEDGQPIIRAFSWKRLGERKIDELIGVCKGVLADGAVVKEEAEFLMDWLDRNREIATQWPASVLYARLADMLTDGVLDSEEEAELVELLVQTTGGHVLTRADSSMSTSLPFDDPPPVIDFDGRQFCLTGKFVFGPRKRCQDAICALGGACQTNPTQKTDFLVIGLVGSRDWMHSTHGRKIESAVRMRDEGRNIRIVSEDHWADFI